MRRTIRERDGRLTRRELLLESAMLLTLGLPLGCSPSAAATKGGKTLDVEAMNDGTAAADTHDLLNLVNPLQGTESIPSFSKGNTLAIVARPFAMTHWALQSRRAERWFFHPSDDKLVGLRATHQPSPWMNDYGNFTIMAAVVGETPVDVKTHASTYRPEDLTIRPDFVAVTFADGLKVEMTPTDRCAVYRFTPPAGKTVHLWIDAPGEATANAADSTFTGRSNGNNGGVVGDFGCRFHAVVKGATFTVVPVEGAHAGIVAVEIAGGTPFTLEVATSFISDDQARSNLVSEVSERGFDAIHQDSTRVWHETLGKIRIEGGAEADLRTFYTCLYRTQLFPRELHEFDAKGKPIHYSPYDGAVHPGVLYGDSGFWDTYRTQFPLLSLLQPEKYGEMVQGFVNAFKEGGWLPQWPSPGLRAVMIGTHIDAVIGDAVVKGITGFDRETAYAGLMHDAETPGDPHDRFGRVGLTDYLTLGYVPSDRANKATARSLDYYYDDFCISQVATALGKTDDATRLRTRALGYHQVFDSSIGFMWGKHADGSWQPNFDEWTWGGPYVEGGPWQSTWAVPHDPAGLIALMGGRAKFVEKLDRMLLMPPRFKPGTYGGVIHEMAEMAAVDFGQYDQGNQPVHLVLYLYAAAGVPAKTQYWARRVMSHLFSADHFSGDEDNGEMSAWYVFNALGFYPLCPGHPSYVLGSPLFKKVTIAFDNGKTLQIDAPNNSPTHVYANAITWDGKPHSHLSVEHHSLIGGGKLGFEMAERPTAHKIADSDLPFSVSAYPAPAESELLPSTIRIACGSEWGIGDPAWVGDCFFSEGNIAVFGATPEPSSVAHPAPAAVYQSERYGTFRYRIPLPMLPGNRAFTVRLHFAEMADAEAGKRLMDVTLNRKAVLTRWDLFAEAGTGKPVVKEYHGILPDHDGAIEIAFTTPADSPDRNAKISGIEVLPEA